MGSVMSLSGFSTDSALLTVNLRTKILDFRGFYTSIILSLRRGILMSIGKFPESLSQQILVGIILVGRLGVLHRLCGIGTEVGTHCWAQMQRIL